MVPVASYRRPSSLIGISVVLVLLASAVDTVVWTYQARRELSQRDDLEMTIPSLSHTDVAAVRARAREAELNRAEAELRQIDQQVLERLRELSDDQRTAIDQARREAIEHEHLTCDPADPLCGLE
ncbi:MAG TPA: hypothetical protein VIG06_13815 [Kofleriaceae bacterium]